MASGLSSLFRVTLNQHLNPCPYPAVPNLAGMELLPRPGSPCLCQALLCPISPHSGLLPPLFTCRIPSSLCSRWGEAPGPAAGQGRRSPPRAGQVSVSSCWERLQPGRALDGAGELEILPRALCPAWPGLPWAQRRS